MGFNDFHYTILIFYGFEWLSLYDLDLLPHFDHDLSIENCQLLDIGWGWMMGGVASPTPLIDEKNL